MTIVVRTRQHPAHFENTRSFRQTAVDHGSALDSSQNTKAVDHRDRFYHNVVVSGANRLTVSSDHRAGFPEWISDLV
jgi:hypothetical protein